MADVCNHYNGQMSFKNHERVNEWLQNCKIGWSIGYQFEIIFQSGDNSV